MACGLALLLAGCTNPNTEAVGSWVGSDVKQLEAAWGAPAARVDVGEGRTQWMWDGWERGIGHDFIHRGCILSAYVDRNGVIYKTRHNGCQGKIYSPDQAGEKYRYSTRK
jgi:hypothetical protein